MEKKFVESTIDKRKYQGRKALGMRWVLKGGRVGGVRGNRGEHAERYGRKEIIPRKD